MCKYFSHINYRRILELAIKILFVVAGCYFIFIKLFSPENISVWHEVGKCFSDTNSLILILLAFLLIPVNIFFEAKKWQVCVHSIEEVPLGRAYIAIFTGLTAGMFFPNRMGDFLGRVFVLQHGSRIKASLATLVGTFAQMIVTVLLGSTAFLFFLKGKFFIIGLCVVVVLFFLLLLCFMNINICRHLSILIPRKYREKVERYISIFSEYSRYDLIKILLFSLVKYLVYSFQFVVLLWAFGLDLTYFNLIIPVAVTYFVMTIVPFITIFEIAVRGSVSMLIFERWFSVVGLPTLPLTSGLVFTASSLLWIFNLAIPALIGIANVNKIKIFRK